MITSAIRPRVFQNWNNKHKLKSWRRKGATEERTEAQKAKADAAGAGGKAAPPGESNVYRELNSKHSPED